MSKSKPHGSKQECLLLIKLKREAAMASMRSIVIGLATPPHSCPQLLDILSYLSNMAYCLELMLKLLSDTWKSHDVGGMYTSVFGVPYKRESLMIALKAALANQKYLFDPSDSLLSEVEGIEELYDELRGTLEKRETGINIQKAVAAPPSFLTYLRDSIDRFYYKEIQIDKSLSSADPATEMDKFWEAARQEQEAAVVFLSKLLEQHFPLSFECWTGSRNLPD